MWQDILPPFRLSGHIRLPREPRAVHGLQEYGEYVLCTYKVHRKYLKLIRQDIQRRYPLRF
jgi:hypothetical protein